MTSTLTQTETIRSGFKKFLDHSSTQTSKEIVIQIDHCLDRFISYAENEIPFRLGNRETTQFKKSKKSLADWAPIGHCSLVLDQFFRYHLLREMITPPELQGYMANVIFHALRWLHEQGKLTDKEMDRIVEVSDRLVSLAASSYNAAVELADYLEQNEEPVQVSKIVDFGRHDVVRIKGNEIWLEIWSLTELPTERLIGPVKVPASVAKVLEPGWIISCLLGMTVNKKWEILESGSIYPALPFRM